MKSNITNIDIKKCTGCGVCVANCPLKCISMKLNNEGFAYPEVVDKSCIECGKCIGVCPTVEVKKHAVNSAFAVQNVNKEDLLVSSSGGMFPLFARCWIEQGGYVCAAKMLNNFELEHVITNNVNDIQMMQGSKYVQSFVFRVYDEMENILKSGKRVLFVGTPCQVAGVKKKFAKYKEQLYCVDLICHGVPSPLFLKKHIVNQYKSKGLISDTVSFRSKSKCETTIYAFKLNNNKLIYANDDAYYNCFVKNYSLRESCYECDFVGLQRVGDITIGDCATSNNYKIFPYGSLLSSVLVNTEKGEKMWEQIKKYTKHCLLDLEQEKKLNRPLEKAAFRPQQRSELYNDFLEMENEKFNQKYVEKASFMCKIKNNIKRRIPLKIKGIIKRGFKV